MNKKKFKNKKVAQLMERFDKIMEKRMAQHKITYFQVRMSKSDLNLKPPYQVTTKPLQENENTFASILFSYMSNL